MLNYALSTLTARWPCYRTCQCMISTGRWYLGRRHSRQVNPGLDKRLPIIEGTSLQDIDDDEVEDLEADFTHAGKMYTSHKSEVEARKDKQTLEIVRRKYFKPSQQPNFLMWAEKEQIRHLHRSDPEEWTTEKLSRSFPVSETTIKKIIKSQWKPENNNKIILHDKSVENNWKALEQQNIHIDEQLKRHLLKFAKRKNSNIDLAEGKQMAITPGSTSSPGTFLNIIQSYSKKSSTGAEVVATPLMSTSDRGDTFVLEDKDQSSQKKSHFTLDQYRQSTDFPPMPYAQPDRGSPVNICNKENKNPKAPTQFIFKENKPSITTANADVFYCYEENITIPKNKWKEGATYKVGECYYDDDGEFLYRVPGMK